MWKHLNKSLPLGIFFCSLAAWSFVHLPGRLSQMTEGWSWEEKTSCCVGSRLPWRRRLRCSRSSWVLRSPREGVRPAGRGAAGPAGDAGLGRGPALRPRSLGTPGTPSKQMCSHSWKPVRRGPGGLAGAVATSAPCGRRADDAGPRGLAGALVQPGPSLLFAPPGARDGRPPERAAGPSVRAAGADWPAGRRGRGRAVPAGGQRRRLLLEDLDALGPRRPGGDLRNYRRSSKSPFSNELVS